LQTTLISVDFWIQLDHRAGKTGLFFGQLNSLTSLCNTEGWIFNDRNKPIEIFPREITPQFAPSRRFNPHCLNIDPTFFLGSHLAFVIEPNAWVKTTAL